MKKISKDLEVFMIFTAIFMFVILAVNSFENNDYVGVFMGCVAMSAFLWLMKYR